MKHQSLAAFFFCAAFGSKKKKEGTTHFCRLRRSAPVSLPDIHLLPLLPRHITKCETNDNRNSRHRGLSRGASLLFVVLSAFSLTRRELLPSPSSSPFVSFLLRSFFFYFIFVPLRRAVFVIMNAKAVLFVSNISSIANAQYLERLFSAYGAVEKVELFGEGPHRYAEVTYGTVDDADTAVAALHCHYQTCRNLPMIVLYSKMSPAVSAYGHQVGEEFMKAADEKRPPRPIALDEFDSNFERHGVQPPPSESDILR